MPELPLERVKGSVSEQFRRGDGLVAAVRELCARELAPLVPKIDLEAYYPESILRGLGRLGAFEAHLPDDRTSPDLVTAVRAMSAVGEHCLTTAFCMWCQDAITWYIFCSTNDGLKRGLGKQLSSALALGGTALSNPMKTFAGIESLRLLGKRVAGGYAVSGLLPFVSNLGQDHYFGCLFQTDGQPKRQVMAVVPCSTAGVSLFDNLKFVALNGTRTFAVRFHEVKIPDEFVLADPLDAYVERIRGGFVLLQTGFGIGLVRDCIRLMIEVKEALGHVNRYLDVQPEQLVERLFEIESKIGTLALTPFEPDAGYWRAVLEARLAVSEMSLAAAQAALLHCGARGYVATGVAQRRLREAGFVAIVTPAIKHLRKMLSASAS